MSGPPRRAVFLDRDGTLNADRSDYVKDWSEFAWLPGVAGALLALQEAGFALVVVTNQGAIAKGATTREAVEHLHTTMAAELAAAGVILSGIYYCPHHDADGCGCRKPAPGLLFQAAADLSLALEESWMVGDREQDIRAGAAAGCRTLMLSSGVSLADAAHQILIRVQPHEIHASARSTRS